MGIPNSVDLDKIEQGLLDIGCEVTRAHAMIHLEQAIQDPDDEAQCAHDMDIASKILFILSQRYYRVKGANHEHPTQS